MSGEPELMFLMTDGPSHQEESLAEYLLVPVPNQLTPEIDCFHQEAPDLKRPLMLDR
jgi:hypothetical protein